MDNRLKTKKISNKGKLKYQIKLHSNIKILFSGCKKQIYTFIFDDKSIFINNVRVFNKTNKTNKSKDTILQLYSKFKKISFYIGQNKIYEIDELENIHLDESTLKMYECSINIPISIDNKCNETLVNLSYIVKHFKKSKYQINILHIDNDNYGLDSFIANSNVNYIYVKNPYHFNLGYCRNLYKFLSLSKIIMFCDVDMPIAHDQIKRMINQTKLYDVVKPYYKKVFKMTKSEKYDFIKGKLTVPNKIKDSNIYTVSGGVTMFRHSVLTECGGYEEFNCYGHEDRTMDVLLFYKKYKIKINDWVVPHLWHPRHKINMTIYNKGKIYCDKYYGCVFSSGTKNIPYSQWDSYHDNCKHKYEFLDNIIEHKKTYNGKLTFFENNKYIINVTMKPDLKINVKDIFNKKYNLLTSQTEFANYVKNKKIAIIGPSPSVRNNKNGDFIENNYDIIIRLNKQWQFSDELQPYIGKRTDILYNCLDDSDECGGSIDIEVIKDKVKFIIGTLKYDFNNKNNRDKLFFKDCILNNYYKFHRKNRGTVKFIPIDNAFYDKYDRIVNTRINTGIMAILHILQFNIKELYIKGFTFFKDGYVKGYKDKIGGEIFTTEENSAIQINNLFNKYKNHKQVPQWRLLKQIYCCKKNIITLDESVAKILHSNTFIPHNTTIPKKNIIKKN